jgi:hypothetical protein
MVSGRTSIRTPLFALRLLLCIAGYSWLQSTFDTVITSVHMSEICDNAIDDDNDGYIDINDPDCICEIVKPESLIPNPSFEEKKLLSIGQEST